MKYRIKEYNWYNGPKYYVQQKTFGLFWVDYESLGGYVPEFNTLTEASEFAAMLLHNKNAKPIIHEIQD